MQHFRNIDSFLIKQTFKLPVLDLQLVYFLFELRYLSSVGINIFNRFILDIHRFTRIF